MFIFHQENSNVSPPVKNILIIIVKTRINKIGFIDLRTTFKGILLKIIRTIDEKNSTPKLNTFLHKKEQIIYKTAKMTLILESKL